MARLTPQTRGSWLVVTQGSCHLWDLDSMVYTRVPRENSRSASFAFDRSPMAITRVERWPQVGSTSFVWYDDPADPEHREHWRQSSQIISIVEVTSTTSRAD